jgi:glycosyltransferase involved in cell wall biosynthesis
MGGTELIADKMAQVITPDLLKEFQIFVSRVEEPLDETKIRIYHLQDLPGDPASDHLANEGWQKFHKLVFSSNWQMQGYINRYNIPWSKCIVMPNAIDPIAEHEKPKDIIRLAYWSTPHRGLNILLPVFKKLCEFHDNIELEVFSSFELYGWGERDEQYKDLLKECQEHPKINYHGSIPNEELKEALKNVHILAYPSIWSETSCISLMEALSAGLVCVHPNLGALYETAAGWTYMYQWTEDLNEHAARFFHILNGLIPAYWDDSTQSRITSSKAYADVFYNWASRKVEWEALLTSLLDEPRSIQEPSAGYFEYRT